MACASQELRAQLKNHFAALKRAPNLYIFLLNFKIGGVSLTTYLILTYSQKKLNLPTLCSLGSSATATQEKDNILANQRN